jgi:hypothetical protein
MSLLNISVRSVIHGLNSYPSTPFFQSFSCTFTYGYQAIQCTIYRTQKFNCICMDCVSVMLPNILFFFGNDLRKEEEVLLLLFFNNVSYLVFLNR